MISVIKKQSPARLIALGFISMILIGSILLRLPFCVKEGVHLSYIGHSILGDTLYGLETNLITRQALHAYKMTFIHPISNVKVEIISPIPNDMEQILK